MFKSDFPIKSYACLKFKLYIVELNSRSLISILRGQLSDRKIEIQRV
jgi:hypothetical protein